jgi:hypothetical protein
VTLPGDAEWPKVADAVIEASQNMPRSGLLSRNLSALGCCGQHVC